MYVCMYIYTLTLLATHPTGIVFTLFRLLPACWPHIGLYTILPFPILYGMYGSKGWSGGNTVLRNSVGDEGGVVYPTG